jgi:hypothetical protein
VITWRFSPRLPAGDALIVSNFTKRTRVVR